MLTLWNLFEASLLCLNAVCVLHEERFMQKTDGTLMHVNKRLMYFVLINSYCKKIAGRTWTGPGLVVYNKTDYGPMRKTYLGWGANSQAQGFEDQSSVKFQILNLVRSIRTVTRIPLILLNILTILFKLLLG